MIYTYTCPNGCDLMQPGLAFMCDDIDFGPYYCPFCKSQIIKSKEIEMNYQVVKCPMCKGEGLLESIDHYTEGNPSTLPGVIMKVEQCPQCSGKRLVRVNVEALNEIY